MISPIILQTLECASIKSVVLVCVLRVSARERVCDVCCIFKLEGFVLLTAHCKLECLSYLTWDFHLVDVCT